MAGSIPAAIRQAVSLDMTVKIDPTDDDPGCYFLVYL